MQSFIEQILNSDLTPEEIETIRVLIIERKEMLDRMIEIEEVSLDETGKPYWSSCGEYLAGGDVGVDEGE